MVKYLATTKSVVILIIFGIMVSSCAPTVSASAMYVLPCDPPTNEGNVYRQGVQPILGSYYQTAFSNPNDLQLYQSMQHEAIKLLAAQTERWSDSIDIALESKFIRITVTYLSPELVQTIILNHYLFRGISNYVNNDFGAHITSKMDGIASRNEHIFFVTTTASKYEEPTSNSDFVIVQLPLKSLVLTNSSNIQVNPQHDDYHLEERIDLTYNPAHGYFSYPMAVNVNETCEFLLDKANNTKLTLSIPYIDINGTRYETRPWILDYAPLIDIAPDPNLMEKLPVARTPEHFCPGNELSAAITPVDAEYWENLARFIWHETTLDP